MSDAEQPTADGPLVPVAQRTVDFYGDQVLAGQLADGRIFVPLRPLVATLGLDWPSQMARLRRDARLRAARGIVVITTPGGRQPMTALPLKFLPGWLFRIDTARVRDDLRAKIERYQEECYEVLWQAFRGEVGALGPPPAEPLQGAALALEIATAMQHLAQDHLALVGRFTALQGQHDTMTTYLRGWIASTNARLTSLELYLDTGSTLTEAQAVEIAGAVTAVAQALEGRGGATPYQQVWGELYRRFRVSAYRNLPAARYQEALDWLRQWQREIAGDAPEQGPLC